MSADEVKGFGAQLRLEPEESDAEPLQVDLQVPERLLKLFNRLEPQARYAVSLRVPGVLQQVIDGVIAVGQMPDNELRLRISQGERDLENLRAEQQRRAEKRQAA